MGEYEDHYERYIDAYMELATCNEGKTVWIPTDEHTGWYVNTQNDDEHSEAFDDGYPFASRPQILPDDFSTDVDRTAYTTISYAKDAAYETKYYKKDGDTIEWYNNDSSRLPDYGDLTAWAIYVDIDIGKQYKSRPLSDTHRSIIEQRLELWVKIFSEMGGGIENVMMLDSGGGMYVFIPPTGLAPVADYYDTEDLDLVFREIGERVREIVGVVDKLICGKDDAPDELFSADKVQNKNRQFKTIGSIHKSLDYVVNPIDPTDITLTHKPTDDINEQDIREAEKWASEFTSDTYRNCTQSIIEYLFQGDFTDNEDVDIEYVDGNTWRDILDNWLEDKKEQLEIWETNLEEQRNITEEQLQTAITQDKDIAKEALRRVNNNKLKQYIVNFVGKNRVYEKSGEEMDFYPFWRETESGRSAFYDFYEGKARFTDKADGTSRNIVYWVALEMTYDDENYPDTNILTSPADDLSPAEYSQCVRELRRRGENVPIYVPDIDDNEKLSIARMKQIGSEIGVLENDDDYIDPDDWNAIIERLNDENITHNREKKEPLKQLTPYIDTDQLETVSAEAQKRQFYNTKGYFLDAFDSIEQYNTFIDELPQSVIPFTYSGEINGATVDGVVIGVFTDETDRYAYLTYYHPDPVPIASTIETYDDLHVKINQNIDKNNMQILQKSSR